MNEQQQECATEFGEVEVKFPNLWMRFKANPKRMERVSALICKEASEAQLEYLEYEQSLKSFPLNTAMNEISKKQN